MTNTLLTPSIIANAALGTLYESNVMAALVWRDYEDEFAKAVGDTITIRKPAVFVANEYNRAAGIQVQDINESSLSMTLNHFKDVSFVITSEQWTLQIREFSNRILTPAMEAISQALDSDLLALRSDIVHTVGTTSGELWNDPNALIAAGRVLTQNKVPGSERRAVVGPVTSAEWLKKDILQKANERGDTVGLREARIGERLFGFDPYETNHITVPTPGAGISTTEVGVAFHRTCFALAVRPLALPRGAAEASIVNYNGLGLRVIAGFDMDKKQDVMSIDILYGTKTIDSNRGVLIQGALG